MKFKGTVLLLNQIGEYMLTGSTYY